MTGASPSDSEVDLQDAPHTTAGKGREQKVSWLELFFDLIFVVAFDQLAKRLGDAPTLENVAAFTLMFLAVWWAWVGNALLSARYGNEGRVYRWGTVLELISMTLIAITVRGDLHQTGWMFAAAYGVNRVIQGVTSLMEGRTHAGPFARRSGGGTLVVAALWLGSLALPSGSTAQFGVWVGALLSDLLLPLMIRRSQTSQADLPHEEHLPERVGLLQIIALGAVLNEVVGGSRRQELGVQTLVPALMSILTVVALWRLYFDQARALPLLFAHLGGKLGRLQAWLYGHVPFTLSIVTLGVGLGHGISEADARKDAIQQQFVVWPLVGAFLTLAFLRLNSLRAAHFGLWGGSLAGRRRDRSLPAVLVAAALVGTLAFLDLNTLQLQLLVAAVAVLAAIVVATDPVTRQLGRLEEKVNEVVTEAGSRASAEEGSGG